MQVVCDTLIISDLHLGSEISRSAEAGELIANAKFRRLILLGDIFADLNFRRLTQDHWEFLSLIRKLSNPRRRKEVIWVEGNHDHGLSEVMSHLVGVPVYQQYVWEYRGIRHLAIHGHQFDRFQIDNLRLSRIGELVFLQLQKWDLRGKRFVRYLDRLNTNWLRLSEKVAYGALGYAKKGKAERVFCGHTHVAMSRSVDGITYYNSGSWIDRRCTFITICEKGVKIHEYSGKRTDDRHPREEREPATAAAIGFSVPPGLSANAVNEGVRR
jgi:UDP-2,3-diacylglucosamine pyrophosphatase LpxH